MVIVPSQWEEPFGRVVFEAAYNKLPVCISAVGGMKEFFSNNGELVTDYQNIDAWQAAIEKLDDSNYYQKCIQCSSQLIHQYSLEEEYKTLVSALEAL